MLFLVFRYSKLNIFGDFFGLLTGQSKLFKEISLDF